MILLLVGGLAGLATLPLWPADWRLGLAVGWCAALVLELWLNTRRAALMRDREGRKNLMLTASQGFLLKLLLLGVGTLLAATAAVYDATAFLLAFLAAASAGEFVGLRAVARVTQSGKEESLGENSR